MVTHDEAHLDAQDLYRRRLTPGTSQHTYDERPKTRGYLYRISRAAALIDDAVEEMRQQRLDGENFSPDFRGLVSNTEQRLWEITATLRRAIEAESLRESSR